MCSGRDCPYCSAKERWMRSWLDNLGLTRQQLRAALGIGSLPGTISSKERQLSLRTIMISRDEQEQIKWEDTFSRQLLASMRSGGPRGSRIRGMLQIAQVKTAVSLDGFNRDPWLLNTPNVVIALRKI